MAVAILELTLVDRARRGDAEAFAVLCEGYRERVWRIACSVSQGADAEDLTQEIFVRAFKGIGRFQGEASFETWLCRIAINLAHDYLKSAWKRRVLLWERPEDFRPSEACPIGLAEQRETARRVRREVAALPEAQRVPIWLHYFEGINLAEVARIEATPEATVRSRVKAGLRKLSHNLGDLLPGGAAGSPFSLGSSAVI